MRCDAASRNPRKTSKRICAWVTVVIVVLLLIIALIVIGFTWRPRVSIRSVSPEDLDISLFPPRLKVSLRLGISVTNMVGIEYTKSTASLKYRDKDFSEITVVPSGESVENGGTRILSLTVTLDLKMGSLLSNPALYADAKSGELHFQSDVTAQGKLVIFHVSGHATCNLNIDFSSRNVTCSL